MVRRASPERTCVGCRRRASSSELLRVVAGQRITMGYAEPPSRETGEAVTVIPDPLRRLPGRGAHLHPDQTCLALAQRRRAFGRALRVAGVVDTGELSEYVTMVAGRQGSEPTRRVVAHPESKVGRPT